MKKILGSLFLCVAFFEGVALGADEEKAQGLVTDVWKASGGENWAKVKELHFTFNVEQDGKTLAKAEHKWNLVAGTDEVKWKDKQVTVNLASPAQDENGKGAYARWVNDSYWLLAPLKLREPGVKVVYEGQKESEGVPCDTLRVSFEAVGLTPQDQYVLYVDPQTKLVRAWDYVPKPETVMHGTWDKYQLFGGLNLSTEHKFGDKVIRFSDITVVTEK